MTSRKPKLRLVSSNPAPTSAPVAAPGLDDSQLLSAVRAGEAHAAGSLYAPGSQVQAPAGQPVSVSLATGTRLRVNGGGRLQLAALGRHQRLVLQAGLVWTRVAPLRAGQRFVLATPDAEVEVRGTAFEVAVVSPRSRCAGAATEVRVFEGLVTVRRGGAQWQVPAGQRWPADCHAPSAPAPPAAITPPPEATRHPAAPPRRRTSVAARPSPPALPSPPSSTLAEQNDSFAAAMQARRQGDVVEAGRLLDMLLARFPFGALAETARAERARLGQ